MTVSTTIASQTFPGNGGQSFPCDFRIFDDTNVEVNLVKDADGTTTTLVLNTDYTISGAGDAAGFTLATTNPVMIGYTLTVERVMPYEQPTDFTNQGSFFPSMHEDMADRLEMQIQQVAGRIDRSLISNLASGNYSAKNKQVNDLADGTKATDATTLQQVETLVAAAAGGVLPGTIALLPDLASTDAGKGAALVGFLQSGLGAVIRTMLDKARDIVHANDWGLVGDGSDETTKLQQLFNAAQGKVLMLGYGKTYGIATATGLSIPANTTLIANGSKFKRLTARSGTLSDAEYNISIGDDCNIDFLSVDAVGGISDIGGVIISGNRVRIGSIRITASTAGSGGLGSLWNAIRVGVNSGKSYDVHIGSIECTNWDRPIFVRNVERFSIGFVSVSTYCRGICFDNCGHGVLRGGFIRSLSPNATGTAGENGVLFDCTLAHNETHDIRIENVTVDGSGEHGFRIGAALTIKNIWHINCHAKNTGAGNTGTYPPNNNGGCGFKALGPTATYGSRHQNIHYIDCSVELINNTSIANLAARGSFTNFAGFQLGKVYHGSIVNPQVRASIPDSGSYAVSGYSSFNGIEIIGCEQITITNPMIVKPYNSGIFIYDFTDGTYDYGAQNQSIAIVGGECDLPGVAGIEVNCSVITMRRINISGGYHSSGGAYSLRCVVSGTGALSNCFAELVSNSPTTESFNGCTAWQIHGRGNFIGANACANGSIYQDANAGTLKYRKAGAWTSL